MPPEGKYTKVKVVNIQSGPGALNDGTATLSSIGVLSCGTFASNDLPKVDEHYNITGVSDADKKSYTFSNYTCVASGATGDFKETTKGSRLTQRV